MNGIGYDTLGLAAPRGEPGRRPRRRSTSATCSACSEGDNPHQWYSPAAVQQVGRRDRRRPTSKLDPADAGVLRRAAARASRRRRSRATTRCAPRSAARFAGVPVGYSESIFEPLGASLGLRARSPRPASPRRSPRAPRSAPRTSRRSSGSSPAPADQGLGLQQPERHAGGRAAQRARRAARIPVVTVTETLSPATRQLRAVAGRASSRGSIAALHRRPGDERWRRRASSCATPPPSIGGRDDLERRDLAIEPGELVAVLGPNGAGKSTLLASCSACSPLARGHGVRPRRAARRAQRAQIGYLPQRHGFDSSTRIRGVDLVRLGLDGDRWGLPLLGRTRAARARVDEVIELVGATAYARAADRRVLGRRAAAAPDRAGARPLGRELLLLDEPLDSLDLPNQTAVVGARSPASAAQQGVAVLLVAHDVNPLLPDLDRVVYVAGGRVVSGPPERGDHERDAERALRRPGRGAAHLRRAARRRRRSRRRPPTTATATTTREPALSWNLVSDVRQLFVYPFMVNALEAGTIVAVHGRGRRAGSWCSAGRASPAHTLSVMSFPGASGAALAGIAARRSATSLACAVAARRDRRRLARRRTGRNRAQESAVIGTVQVGGLRARLPLPQPLRRRAREPRDAALRLVPRDHARPGADAARGRARRRSPSSPSPAGRSSTRSVDELVARAARRAGARCSSPPSCSCSASPSRRPRRSPACCSCSRCSSRRPPPRSSSRRGSGSGSRSASAIALAVTWLGLALSYYTDYPVGFFVTTLGFAAYLSRARGVAPADPRPARARAR